MGWRSVSCLTLRRGGWWWRKRQARTEATFHGEVKVGLTEKRTLEQESTLKLFGGRAFQAEYSQSPVATVCPQGPVWPEQCKRECAEEDIGEWRAEWVWGRLYSAPWATLSALKCTFTSQKGGASWGVLSRGHFRGSPLAAVLKLTAGGQGWNKPVWRLMWESSQPRTSRSSGQALAVEGLRRVFLT